MRPQVTRVERNSEVWAAAQLVGGIHRRIRPLREMRAYGSDEMPAGGKADHADLVRIDTPLRGVLAHQPDRALRVLQRRLYFRIYAPIVLVVPPRTRARHT